MLNLRNRKEKSGAIKSQKNESNGESKSKEDKKPDENSSLEVDLTQLKKTYWLNRIIFLRYLAFIYCVAFLVALHQNKQLIGKYGLLPADSYFKLIKNHFGENNLFKAFLNVPTLMIFVDNTQIDWWLDIVAVSGLTLSIIILVTGAANMVMLIVLWLLYHSIVNIGQKWYSFGWESQLLESGFLTIFFVPLLCVKQLSKDTKPSWVVIWGNRWLIFRIMMGAGLIKIRGDQCWRDLTCMEYHYQTQPVPNPISYYLHQSPVAIHKLETLSNHFIELIAPILLIFPRKCRIIGGSIQILFQIVLIVSGNLSFLNWLTVLPSIACFDDYTLSSLFSDTKVKKVLEVEKSLETNRKQTLGSFVRIALDCSLFVLIAVLSIPVVKNLFSSQQAMNTSFDSFRIVNTYGAFGSVTKKRTEVIIQGTRNRTLLSDEAGGKWEEYEFHCKPGDISRRPCLISPYHYRLDWLMWFSAFQDYQNNPWLIHLAAKLLVNDRNASSLISYNPFENGKPPTFIRGMHYKYEYTKIGSGSPNWWKRKLVGSYFPAVDLRSLKPFLSHHQWKVHEK